MDAQKFGTFIAQCRKEKHMTQTELAKKLMITDKAVSRWERGKGFPDISLLLPLASALDLSLTELMCSEKKSGAAPYPQNDAALAVLMENAVEMNHHTKNRNRSISWLADITMLVTAVFIKICGYGSIGGGLFAGAFIAFIPIGLHLLIKSRKDSAGRKVYSVLILLGMFLALLLFTFLNVETVFLLWGSFLLFCITVGILNI